MKTTILTGVLFLLLASVVSCNRSDGNETPVAGKGGSAVLKVTPKHHASNIDSCLVYIKYNTLDAAANYDDSTWAVLENGVPVATFSGLKNGNYYLFGRGWDPAIMQSVRGGIPQPVSEQKTYNLVLPVSEEH